MLRYFSQVLIVGGGATGVGILRDLSMRGIPALLLEQGDLAHGTSSRFHGLLHSGARYAVSDPGAASECARENAILKRIAPGCIAQTGGWFVQTAGDDPFYREKWQEKCIEAGIPVREVPVAEALAKEPLLSERIEKVFEVPDAAVDGFELVWANAKSAQKYGGEYKTYHKVERLLRKGSQIIGVAGFSVLTGEEFVASGEMVVNAAGPWASALAESAGVHINLVCDKGTLIAFNQRLFNRVINRLHSPGDGDIFVPHQTITIFGTTSEIVDSPLENNPARDEAIKLIKLGEKMLPGIGLYRVIRAFAGVRPLYLGPKLAGQRLDKGRGVSRNFAIIDHEGEEGIGGLLSIAGGKFTAFRLMAEQAADLVARRLGTYATCRTATESLAAQTPELFQAEALRLLPFGAVGKMLERLGPQAETVLAQIRQDPGKGQLLCECEMVTAAEVENAMADPDAHCLSYVRRKTRLGMGSCQGTFCAYRALPLLAAAPNQKYGPFKAELSEFLNRRWKGIRPVLWGSQLRETELARAIYACTLNLSGTQE